MAIVFPSPAGDAVPWAVIGHRTFDAKAFRLRVGDDQEKRLGRFGSNSVSMPPLLTRIFPMINDVELNRFAVVL
jgi:hypothetical protein